MEEGIAIDEEIGPIPVFDLGSKLTPQQLQKTREEYLKWVRNRYNTLETHGILTPDTTQDLSEKPLPYSKMYVPVKISAGQNPIPKLPSETSGLARERDISEREWLKEQRKLKDYNTPFKTETTIEGKVFDNIADILALPEKKFVILGEVGAGKSTLLKYMTYLSIIF